MACWEGWRRMIATKSEGCAVLEWRWVGRGGAWAGWGREYLLCSAGW